MTQFYARAYSNTHTGFYFDSVEAFEAGMERLKERTYEEVEIQFIDGEDHLAALAKAICIGQGDIEFWFEELEELDTQDTTRICFLLDCGYSLEDTLTRYEWVYLHYGSTEDYARELIEETTNIPENLRYYIDYEAIARDMRLNGEIVEIEHDLIVTNARDF